MLILYPILQNYFLYAKLTITYMSKICTICDKHSTMVTRIVLLRGKYNPTTKRRKYPNIQWVTLPSGKRVKACTKCIKRMSLKKK
ncbi:MAG: hypothetical protein COU81_02335 [Candidatus Portnoybacteria bacterium CG10_big_fil_rev_8_21_14_0_10_36_7]|uniref:50S ribosomal protein L28 n=1 Tax=Candidatus Portnoybacteria bacterium CG10_big_fil_rev_8_21_14_0_10_36_7 TaxID=1974812 RepID=A0A2M8KDY1_9BACT|nr:MAG: hypothetical protein COU81_02335 [Candidatus Portnoybacteria bacterium CG10_big_fil_rev_8_21_14_0_10_36_7]